MTDTPTTAPGLEPCPWCHGPTWALCDLENHGKPRWSCKCTRCGAEGPRKKTENEAIAAWNSRAPSQPAAQAFSEKEREALEAGANALELKTRVRIFRAASDARGSSEIDVTTVVDKCNEQTALLRSLAARGKVPK